MDGLDPDYRRLKRTSEVELSNESAEAAGAPVEYECKEEDNSGNNDDADEEKKVPASKLK